jgi:hypothetical protein
MCSADDIRKIDALIEEKTPTQGRFDDNAELADDA